MREDYVWPILREDTDEEDASAVAEAEAEEEAKANIEEFCDRTNPKCIFHEDSFVGNEIAAEQLCTILFSSLENKDRVFGVGPIFFDAPPSSGKTFAIKLLAKASGLPLVELDSNIAKSTDDVVEHLRKVVKHAGLILKKLPDRNGLPCYEIPPMIFFYDEFHTVNTSFGNGLLRAMEKSDSIITSSEGMYDCSKVLWVVATTEIGQIYKKNNALLSRFNPIVRLQPPTMEDVAKIVKIQPTNNDWTMEECLTLVKRFGRVPRQATAFAKQINVKMRHQKCSRIEAIDIVARENGVDADGVHNQDIVLLEFLGRQYPNKATYSELVSATGFDEDQIRELIIPRLTRSLDGKPPCITRGFCITRAGVDLLLARGLISESCHSAIK